MADLDTTSLLYKNLDRKVVSEVAYDLVKLVEKFEKKLKRTVNPIVYGFNDLYLDFYGAYPVGIMLLRYFPFAGVKRDWYEYCGILHDEEWDEKTETLACLVTRAYQYNEDRPKAARFLSQLNKMPFNDKSIEVCHKGYTKTKSPAMKQLWRFSEKNYDEIKGTFDCFDTHDGNYGRTLKNKLIVFDPYSD